MGATTVVTTDEREDEIERLRHEGRVHRWSRKRSAWPGHTTFVALRGGEVVVGDRYAAEGVERTYACELAALLEGCFQDIVAQQLGPRVLEELLAEVRRELGVAAGPSKPPAAAPAVLGASAPAPAPAAAKVVSAPSKPTPAAVDPAVAVAPAVAVTPSVAPAAAKPAERPSMPKPATVSTPGPAATPGPDSTPAGGPVDLTVVACPSVGLPLAVALRGLVRTSVHELLGRLRSLPCRVAAGVPREQAEGVAARLTELGAAVQLLPAGGS